MIWNIIIFTNWCIIAVPYIYLEYNYIDPLLTHTCPFQLDIWACRTSVYRIGPWELFRVRRQEGCEFPKLPIPSQTISSPSICFLVIVGLQQRLEEEPQGSAVSWAINSSSCPYMSLVPENLSCASFCSKKGFLGIGVLPVCWALLLKGPQVVKTS